jgi:hypothetical protein
MSDSGLTTMELFSIIILDLPNIIVCTFILMFN